MMVSNLGVLPFEADFGDLRLEALWGPSVFVGIEGEQMIGAATVRGAIHLLHSSYTPIASLLETTEQVLRVAGTQVAHLKAEWVAVTCSRRTTPPLPPLPF